MADADVSPDAQASLKQMQSPGLNYLCKPCRDLCKWHLKQGFNPVDVHKHHGHRQVLQASAQTCKFCSILLRHINLNWYDNPPLEGRNRMPYEIQTTNDYSGWTKIVGCVPELMPKGDDALLDSSSTNLWLSCSRDKIRSRAIWQSKNPKYEDRFSTLREWIWECDTGHEKCKESVECRPKRLLDLGPIDDGMNPKLVYATRIAEDMRYTTLSHCWGPPGTKGPLRTTKENEQAHLDGIPLRAIPQSFKDAMLVTRKLGVRYLWIDSLCIIQNSKVDCELESDNMGEIYSNSFLTIAAADSQNSSGGFLLPRPECITKPLAGLSCMIGDGMKLPIWA